jgi:gliding motility-associated-like protein
MNTNRVFFCLKLNKIALLFILTLVFGIDIWAQPITFRRDYAISLFDLPANSVESLNTGNYIIAGTNINLPITSSISELDQVGNVIWSKRYSSTFAFQLTDLKRDDALNQYYTVGGNNTGAAVFMIVDNLGDPVVSRTFTLTNSDGVFLNAVNKTSDGGYIAAGYVTGHNPGGGEMYFAPITYTRNNGETRTDQIHSPIIVKFDAAGNHVWHRVTRYYYNAGLAAGDAIYNSASFRDVIEVGDGFIAVGGYKVNEHRSNQNSDGDDATPRDAIILKTNSTGDITYHYQIDTPNDDASQTSKYYNSIRPTVSGQPLLAGYHGSGRRIIGQRLPASGGWTGTTWSRRLSVETVLVGPCPGFTCTTSNDEVEARIFEISDGNYGILGFRVAPLAFDFSTVLMKFNPNTNNFIFRKRIQGSFFASFFPVGGEVSDGGFISLKLSGTALGWNFNLTKTDVNGELNSTDCPDDNVYGTSSGYTPTWAIPHYNSWANSPAQTPSVTPIVQLINPVETIECLVAPCVPPPLADNVTATPNPICAGESTTINATGPGTGVSYFIYDAPAGGTNLGAVPQTFSPGATTTYYIETVDNSDPNCVSSTRVPIEVVVNPAPTAIPSSNSPVCEGDNINLNATTVTGGSYAWTGPNSFNSTDQNPVIPNATTANDGSYTLIVTANNCPSAPVSVNVVVSPTPTANPDANDTEICEGEDIELTANTVAGGTYSWTGPGGFTSSDQNPVIPNANTGQGGTYSLVISVGSCSSDQEDVTITVNPSPTVSASNDGPVCLGEEVNFTSSGGTSYSWTGPGGFTNGNQNFTIGNAATTDQGTYEVTVTDGNGCSATAQTSFTISPGPDLTVSSEDVSCNGEDDGEASVSATGNGPFNYEWNPGGLSGAQVTGLAPNTYTVTVTDGNGCASQATVTIDEPDAIDLSFNSSEADCNVDNGSAEVTATGGAGGFSYAWSPGGQTTSSINNVSAGIYQVTVEDASGCSVSGSVTINSANAPTLSVAQVTDLTCNGAGDGSATISATGGIAPYTYSWSPTGGTAATAENLSAGTYTVTVTDDDDCPAFIEVTINEPDAIVVSGETADAVCGNFNGSIDLTVSGGTGSYSYSWTPSGLSGNSLSNLAPGTYTVIVTDANGCEQTTNFIVGVSGNIPITVIPQVVTIEAGQSTQLEVIVGGGVINETYTWTPADGLSCTNCPDPVASPTQTTTYTVTVTTDDGCVSSDTVLVIVEQPCTEVFVPTIFSPNGDDINDLLCVEGSCIRDIDFRIFNRWGEIVFMTKDPAECWDGTQKGEPLNTGVFAFKAIIITNDGQEIEKSGTLTLVK